MLELADVGLATAARLGDRRVRDAVLRSWRETFDTIVVPVGVGSLAAAAARYGAQAGVAVIGAEPDVAACLTAALAAGEPAEVPTPGTAMAGLDCAVVSAAAWDSLPPGSSARSRSPTRRRVWRCASSPPRGLTIGDSGAAPLAALHALREDPACAALRDAVPLDRVLLIATRGADRPEGLRATVG